MTPAPTTGPAGQVDAVRPLPLQVALRRIARCAATTVVLVARGRLHQPGTWVGERLRFADGTSAVVYRETAVDRPSLRDPVVVVVEFRMWLLNGRRGQMASASTAMKLARPTSPSSPAICAKLLWAFWRG